MGQYPPMRRNKRGPLTVMVLAGVLSISLVMRLGGRLRRLHAPRAARTVSCQRAGELPASADKAAPPP
jgi:hypothetical protein